MQLRKVTPRSLYTRFLLIIILPMVLVQLIATHIFYERHWESMSRHLANSLAGEVALIIREYQQIDHGNYDALEVISQTYLKLQVTIIDKEKDLSLAETHEDFSLFKSTLDTLLKVNYNIYYDSDDDRPDLVIRVYGQQNDLLIQTPYKRLANPTTTIFILWMVGSSIILLGISILFLRNQVRSILDLAKVADAFGKGHDMPGFKPHGAREIRAAGLSFIQMRERIKRLIKRRTDMLTGISHDLKTPLTRMRLQLEMMKDKKAKAAMEDDIKEMEQMVQEYIDFARGADGESSEQLSLDRLVKHCTQKYDDSTLTISAKLQRQSIFGKRNALIRCIQNLIDNAKREADNLTITMSQPDEQHIQLILDDDGPGIPEDRRDDVFQPFVRLEHSRNRDTGGVGLGLSIAQDIMHSHGGEITLSDSPQGGLRVTLTFPI